jgi:hypothetical protein
VRGDLIKVGARLFMFPPSTLLFSPRHTRDELSSAETCNGSRDALFQPVFVMQTAQDVLRSDFTVTWQSVPLHF